MRQITLWVEKYYLMEKMKIALLEEGREPHHSLAPGGGWYLTFNGLELDDIKGGNDDNRTTPEKSVRGIGEGSETAD